MIYEIKFVLDYVDGWLMLIKCYLVDDCFEIVELLIFGIDLVLEYDVYMGIDMDVKISD